MGESAGMGTTVAVGGAVVVSAGVIIASYYQYNKGIRKLKELIASDPYAYYIRHKLYDCFSLLNRPSLKDDEENPSTMHRIMKYGFPGLDDVRLYSDFVLSFDRRNRVAHWVCEHLQKPCVNNEAVSRQGAEYQPDMAVDSIFRVEPADFRDSGYDRGHLAASANHRCDQSHCNETFYLTNIAPQVGKGFNRHAWHNLEIYVREITERYESVYVYTGPLYLPKRSPNTKFFIEYEVFGPRTIAVPTHFFKVIIVESKLEGGRPYMEAYVLPNRAICDKCDLRCFLWDIRDVERAAGLKFFQGIRRSDFFATNYLSKNEIYENFQ